MSCCDICQHKIYLHKMKNDDNDNADNDGNTGATVRGGCEWPAVKWGGGGGDGKRNTVNDLYYHHWARVIVLFSSKYDQSRKTLGHILGF